MSGSADAAVILEVLRSVLPAGMHEVGLHEPSLSGNEWRYIKECLDAGWVSSAGSYVDRFEELLSGYTGTKKAVAVVNGTSALHICLRLVGVGDGDEVIVPALTFVATANAVTYCGAVPHFADSDEKTLGLDPEKLEMHLGAVAEVRAGECFNRVTGRRIRAVVPVHTFGHPIDLDPLVELCQRFCLEIIEDAAESLGSFYKGRHTGNWGRVSAVSFNGNKIATTGGGGAILTNDEELGRLAKHLTTTARVDHPWELAHDRVGYNYRMPNINAALGCAQIEQLPGFIVRKRALARRYQEAFASVAGVTFFSEPRDAESNYWLNVLLLDRECRSQREGLLELLHTNGIHARPAWTLMNRLPMYRDCPRMDLTMAEELAARIVNIPSSAALGSAYA